MQKLVVNSKGQLVLPKSLLRQIGASAGEALMIDISLPGRLTLTLKKNDISRVFGMLKHRAKRRLSIKEINEITAKAWAGEK
jgi:bifunctional DNA-binding transcriptional regulator/antitoxin component of YhaV-PrlF toxin-antitoxin module